MLCKSIFFYICVSLVLAACCAYYTQEPKTSTDLFCGEGEVLRSFCVCDATCENQNPSCSFFSCPPGRNCNCFPGYARVEPHKCIPIEECQVLTSTPEPETTVPSCPPGEQFNECATECEGICSEPPSENCSDICLPPQCQCIEGYARNDYGVCIPRYDCPPLPPPTTSTATTSTALICGEGELLRSACVCDDPTCENHNPICSLPCTQSRHCICAPGYARVEPHKCIHIDDCPVLTSTPEPETTTTPSCPPGEQFRKCASLCEGTCLVPIRFCPFFCRPSKCQCLPGYVRNEYGVCIPRCECPPISTTTTAEPTTTTQLLCGPGEEARSCPICEGTCSQPYVPPRCPFECPVTPRCLCKPGYVRNNNGECILPQDCPYE